MASPNPGQEALQLQAPQQPWVPSSLQFVCSCPRGRSLDLLLGIQRCFPSHNVTVAPSLRERTSQENEIFGPCPQLVGNRFQQKAVIVGRKGCVRERTRLFLAQLPDRSVRDSSISDSAMQRVSVANQTTRPDLRRPSQTIRSDPA